MRLTVWQAEVALYRRDALFCTWREHTFWPAALVVEELPSGAAIVRSKAAPIAISAPVGSRLELEASTPRLSTHFNPAGLDATSVAHLAARGERGFRVVREQTTAPDPRQPAATSGRDWEQFVAESRADEAAELEAMETVVRAALRSQPFMQVGSWGIAFESRHYPARSFLASSSRGFGPVRSTVDLAEVARWPAADQAAEWLAGSGLDPGRPVPVGSGFLFPSVAQIPADPAELRGLVFELTPRPPAAAVADARPARAGQATFAFAG